MAVNWNLALQQTGREAIDYIDAFNMGHKASLEQNAINERNASRAKAGQQLQSGDLAGAQQTAVQSGDFDFAKAVQGMGEDQHKQALERADVIGSVAQSIKGVPQDQREQAFRQAVPALRAHLPLEEIQNAYKELKMSGFADGTLDGYTSAASSVKDQLANLTRQNEQYTLAPGSSRYDARGNVVAAQPFAPELRSVAPGETLVEVNKGGGDQSSAPIGDVAGYIQQNGGTVTSGARSPERNAKVGGVTNSLHLSGDAIDSVPPQGVSMSNWAQHLTEQFPGARVINENDHVHIQQPHSGMGRVVAQGAPKPSKEEDAPSGYRFNSDGTLAPIPGGPADPTTATNRNVQSNRKAEADLRKEFDGLAETKNFRTIDNQGRQILELSKKPSAQNDIAMIFSYMKMLDPTSVVREGEFATAQNAAGIPDRIKNIWNKAQNGERLNPDQRKEMVNSAYTIFKSARDAYNQRAEQFRGYASDNGVEPDRVASLRVDKPAAKHPDDIAAILKKYAK